VSALELPEYRLPGTTYLVERDGWVKVGATRHLTTRLAALREPRGTVHMPEGMDPTGPLVLLATVSGNVERYLHRRWAHLRGTGEWFRPDAEMRADIESLASA
jgi:hypothetical protein